MHRGPRRFDCETPIQGPRKLYDSIERRSSESLIEGGVWREKIMVGAAANKLINEWIRESRAFRSR